MKYKTNVINMGVICQVQKSCLLRLRKYYNFTLSLHLHLVSPHTKHAD